MSRRIELLFPSEAHVRQRLRQILDRGSVNLGAAAGIDRLLVMLTRSCELRCTYCLIRTTEEGRDQLHPATETDWSQRDRRGEPLPPVGEMSSDILRRSVDFLMRSSRETLQLQLFGGEPLRRFELVLDALDYMTTHPNRRGRKLEFILTTNGIGLTAERVEALSKYPLMVLFSLDGSALDHSRFRPTLLGTAEESYDAIRAGRTHLERFGVNWFMNVTLAPSAADEIVARYLWARAQGIPRFQLNYAMGLYWEPQEARAYLRGLQQILHHHASDPGTMRLFNWRSDTEPVLLSEDLIVDVDGTIYHDGAIFMERRFPRLRLTDRLGHIRSEPERFDGWRWTLEQLHTRCMSAYPEGTPEHRAIEQNILMGAAIDLVIHYVRKRLGIDASNLC